VLALMNEFINRKKDVLLNIVSLEKERSFLEYMDSIRFNDSRDDIYSFIREVYTSGEGTYYNINLKILFGDARETLSALNGKKFNAVFQDPFSPSKNPELWSVEYFIVLKSLLTDNGFITTYSSAAHIRRAMFEAGLRIGRGPSVGKKREGTIAGINEIPEEIINNDIDAIFSNIKSMPYEDPGFTLSREAILENRLIKIKKQKNESK